MNLITVIGTSGKPVDFDPDSIQYVEYVKTEKGPYSHIRLVAHVTLPKLTPSVELGHCERIESKSDEAAEIKYLLEASRRFKKLLEAPCPEGKMVRFKLDGTYDIYGDEE